MNTSTAPDCPYCREHIAQANPNHWAKLGVEYSQTTDLIAESDCWLAIAGLGALCVGYVLLLPKAHVPAIGYLTQRELSEYVQLKRLFRSILTDLYGPVVSFEHGMGQDGRGGGCIDHAHLHMLPSPYDFRPEITRNPALLSGPLPHTTSMQALSARGQAYLAFEDQMETLSLYPIHGAFPSQFVRRLWAASLGKADEWDWQVFLYKENIAKTIRDVRASLKAGKSIELTTVTSFRVIEDLKIRNTNHR